MPAFNEEGSIVRCLERVLKQPLVKEVIVVNDASKDRTAEIVMAVAARDPRVRLENQEKNQGKGAALRRGFATCSGEIIIIQDADMEYDPSDYAKVLEPILKGMAEVSFGSRFLGGGARRVLYFWHCVGNQWLTTLSNCFSGLNLSDMETGMKAFRSSVVQRLHLHEDRFGIEPEITIKVARLNVPVYEVAISYYGRTYAEGKKIGWKDGVWALWCIVKYGIFSRN
jgi:glycosyltransferase involved in cell wall biosynthesis